MKTFSQETFAAVVETAHLRALREPAAAHYAPSNWRNVERRAELRTFAMPGETQTAAIKRLMAGIKREQKSDWRTSANFPKWEPGMSTRTYLMLWHSPGYGGQHREDSDEFVNCAPDRPAPYYTDPEVVAEEFEIFAAFA